MIQLPEGFDSIFRYVVVVSQRAEQLIHGAKPRSDSRHAKPTLVARDDVAANLVPWRILTQEELDAQRQAIVEQFRAEVGTQVELAASRPVRDVLPTSEEEEVLELPTPPMEEERDDELDRLQRLLGMVRGRSVPTVERDAGLADREIDFEDDEEESEDDLTLDLDEVEPDFDGDGDSSDDD